MCNVENAVEPQLRKVKTNLAEFLGFYLFLHSLPLPMTILNI